MVLRFHDGVSDPDLRVDAGAFFFQGLGVGAKNSGVGVS
jgi:hypothetical protein